MSLNATQIKMVLNLPAFKRYEHFIKTVADTQIVWSLYNDGWALASDGIKQLFPLWPHEEYAKICAEENWKSYTPKRISIYDLENSFIPQFEEKNTLLTIFYTPSDKGIILEGQKFWEDLKNEILENYL